MIEKSQLLINHKTKLLSLLATLLIFCSHFVNAQISSDSIKMTVKQVAETVSKRYIDSAVALTISDTLYVQLSTGKFDQIKSGKELASQLTLTIRKVIDDRHLNVYYSDRDLENLNGFATTLTQEQLNERYISMKKENFGLRKVDILPGNIGYIDFKYFGPLEYSGKIITTAMDSIADTNALIIDLRSCSGSMSEDFNMMFPGYFLQKSVFLSTMKFRASKKTKQNWSYGYVPGKKYYKPVYILTSGGTFSGAEGLAYCLQALKRVTIVGDITGGAANPVGSITLNKHFGVNMPEASVINTITQTNWERVGVIPEVKITASDALRNAHLIALDSIKKHYPELWKEEYKLTVAKLKANQPVTKTIKIQLKGYTDAKSVSIVGAFNYWGRNTNPLQKDSNGVWMIKLVVPKGKMVYRFVVDNLHILDPENSDKEGNASVKVIN